jgi:serologically defined colon cancer antigen 8
MGEAESNWKYNVSKKIAQLTKVIFRLHSESLDRRDLVSHIKQRCEKEISNIVEQSGEAIKQAQQDAGDYKDSLERIMREEYEAKFQNHSSECTALKERLEAEAKALADRCFLQLSHMRREIDAMKTRADGYMAASSKALEDLDREHKKVLDLLLVKHKRELENTVNESNVKYNALVAESARREEEIKNEMQKEMFELKRTATADTHLQLEGLKRKVLELEGRNLTLERAAKKSDLAAERSKATIAHLESETERIRSTHDSVLKELTANHDSKIASLIDEFRADKSTLQSELDALKKKFDDRERDYQSQLESLRALSQERENGFVLELARMRQKLAANDAIPMEKWAQLNKEHAETVAALEAKYATLLEDTQRKEALMHE